MLVAQFKTKIRIVSHNMLYTMSFMVGQDVCMCIVSLISLI